MTKKGVFSEVVWRSASRRKKWKIKNKINGGKGKNNYNNNNNDKYNIVEK